MSGENDDDESVGDMTRVEDLSEFLHEDNDEIDSQLDDPTRTKSDDNALPSLDDLDSDDELPSVPSEPEETSFDEATSDDVSDFSSDATDPDLSTDTFNTIEEEIPPPPTPDTESDTFESESSFEETESFGEEETSFGEDSEEETSFGEDNEEETSFGEDTEEETNFGEGAEEETSFGEVTEDETSFGDDIEEETSFEEVSTEEPEETETSLSIQEEEEVQNILDTGSAATELEEDFEAPNNVKEMKPVSRENFSDVRDFGNRLTYGLVSTGGNPPYSLIVQGIKFEEDAEDILIVLREHGLVTDENEETMQQGLEHGAILISQISEYSAIYLCHRLRRFDVELMMGLSDELHPSKSYERDGKGLVSRFNLNQNSDEEINLDNNPVDIDHIIVTTTPTLEGYVIKKYLEVISSHTIVNEDELKRLTISNDEFSEDLSEEEEDLSELGLNEVYKELAEDLKNKAYKMESNAVVGLNYIITPLIKSEEGHTNADYKITCTGNAVWIVGEGV